MRISTLFAGLVWLSNRSLQAYVFAVPKGLEESFGTNISSRDVSSPRAPSSPQFHDLNSAHTKHLIPRIPQIQLPPLPQLITPEMKSFSPAEELSDQELLPEIGQDGYDGARTSSRGIIRVFNVFCQGVLLIYWTRDYPFRSKHYVTAVRFALDNAHAVNQGLALVAGEKIIDLKILLPNLPNIKEEYGTPLGNELEDLLGLHFHPFIADYEFLVPTPETDLVDVLRLSTDAWTGEVRVLWKRQSYGDLPGEADSEATNEETPSEQGDNL